MPAGGSLQLPCVFVQFYLLISGLQHERLIDTGAIAGGNLTTRTDAYQGWSENFCYDTLNRVTSYALGASCTSSGKTTLAYSTLGNINRKSDICNTTNCFVYGGSGAGPHALTSIVGTYNGVTNPAFAYDADGNMTGGGGRATSYMSFNMASSITEGTVSLALIYGAEHQRMKMCAPDCAAPSATTLYLADPVFGLTSEKVTAGSTTTWRDYIVAPGAGLVAERFKTGASVSWRYMVADHLGSVVAVSDTASPPNVERDSYDPWGKRRNADGTPSPTCSLTSQTTRGYTAHEMLDSLCLINMNARIQDPSLGRFMSADTIVPDPLNGQSFNRYSYVDNNPLAFIDPSGHQENHGPIPDGDCSDSNTCPPALGSFIHCQNGCGGLGLSGEPQGLGSEDIDGADAGGNGKSGAGKGSANSKPACLSATAVATAQYAIAGGTSVALAGAALDLGAAGTEAAGGGPEDPFADVAAYWEASTGTQMMRGGTTTVFAASAFLLANGMPREATNAMFDVALDMLDKGAIPEAGQQLIDQNVDKAMNAIEDKLGLAEDTCVKS